MARQKQTLITAQHIERVDAKGNPQIKQFTQKAWADIPQRHYSSKEDGIVKQAKNGWVQVGEATGAKAPEPLKAQAPKPQAPVQEAPKPKAGNPFADLEKV